MIGSWRPFRGFGIAQRSSTFEFFSPMNLTYDFGQRSGLLMIHSPDLADGCNRSPADIFLPRRPMDNCESMRRLMTMF